MDWLDKIIADDDMGLLVLKPKSIKPSPNDRLASGFEEINIFVDAHNRTPALSGDILENQLFYRLDSIKNNPEKTAYLKPFDRHNVLKITLTPPKSLDEVFADDDFGILSGGCSIFELRPELKPSTSNRSVGTFDFIGRQVKCKDFDKFEPMFKKCQSDLNTKKRILQKFKTELSIKPGAFLVISGMLLYVDSVGEFSQRNTRQQARIRCIYDNGTESNILRNSLAKRMYSEGQIVTESTDDALDNMKNIGTEDIPSGYLYILQSLSNDPNVKNISDLYKIGYSETPVEERIKNAINEPTYLMSKVKIVATYKMYNVNTQKFENLMHKFFDSARISIDVIDHNGQRHTPREWFQIPLEIIKHAIVLLQSGDIINYKYCRETKNIISI